MHLGIIPDGNRRYMRKIGITSLNKAYRHGIRRFYDVLEWCHDLGMRELTIYTLSIENIRNRGKAEVYALLNLFSKQAVDALNDKRIAEREIRVNICGDKEYLSTVSPLGASVVERLNELEESTKKFNNFNLNLAIAYGGRQELINATRKVVEDGLEINEENIERNLWIKNSPEVIIRTAESRLSNFLLWQSAYSEIYFVDKLWGEFEREDLLGVLDDYNSKERRFGK